MSFLEKLPRKRGDRKDGVWVKDAPGLNIVMTRLFPNRTDCEVFLNQEIDITELLKFIDEKNGPDAEYKTTLFHCFVTMVCRVLNERRLLNRFVQGGRIYERDEITVSFVAKRRFSDHSEETLMQYKAKGKDKLEDISRFIVGDVKQMRERKESEGLDVVFDKFQKVPRWLLISAVKLVRVLDFWGKVPDGLTKGDSNYASVLISNLGSIRCPAVYHHLNNYGTTSIMITLGTIHQKNVINDDGSVEKRDFIDMAAILDERIADGFYFARSLKLIQHICLHPEILDIVLSEESGYEFI